MPKAESTKEAKRERRSSKASHNQVGKRLDFGGFRDGTEKDGNSLRPQDAGLWLAKVQGRPQSLGKITFTTNAIIYLVTSLKARACSSPMAETMVTMRSLPSSKAA